MRKVKEMCVLLALLCLVSESSAVAISKDDFERAQKMIQNLPSGDRISFWAEQFIGTPFDPDPLGEYVRKRVIVSDERVDCMYMTFRTVELAFSSVYEEAVENALNVRFHSKGILNDDGTVANYDERFQYGIDMIRSGKWGQDVSSQIAETVPVRGERGKGTVEIIDRKSAAEVVGNVHNGDIIFFIKDPDKRKVGEIVGHIGIASVQSGKASLVHASGSKNGKGRVTMVDLKQYLTDMSFIGIIVMRLD